MCSCGPQLGWMDGMPEEEEVEYLGDDVADGEGEDVGAGDLVGAVGVSRRRAALARVTRSSASV